MKLKLFLLAAALAVIVPAKAQIGPNGQVGVVVGGITGALIGNHNNHNGIPGAIIGAAAGLIVGNAIDFQNQNRLYTECPPVRYISQPCPTRQVIYYTPVPVYYRVWDRSIGYHQVRYYRYVRYYGRR